MSFRSFVPYSPETENNFQQTLAETINAVCSLVQVGVDGENPNASDNYARMVNVINHAVLEMQVKGLHISSYQLGYLFLQPNQNTYIVEDEHATNSYVSNVIAADVTSGVTYTVNTPSNLITAGDYVGITLDDGSLFWTTCVSFVSPTLVVTDVLPSQASAGNYILSYTTPIRQISRVHQVLRRDNYVNDVPLSMISQQEWDTLNNKLTSTGQPNQMYYKRSIPKGTMYMWPIPQNSLSIVWFWYECKLGQMKDPTTILDMDQFYLPAFKYLCALRACDEFGISTELYQRIEATAEKLMGEALSYDDEGTPIKISPNQRI